MTTSCDTRPRPVVTPRLRGLLRLVFLLLAALAVNSVYLAAVTLAGWLTGTTYEDYFYLLMFLAHLALGLLLIPFFLAFGIAHLRRAWRHPKRRVVRAGLGLLAAGITVLATGLALTRFPFFELDTPAARSALYWLHVVAPLVAIWLFVLHRLVGRPIAWRTGLGWGAVAAGFAVAMLGWHTLAAGQRSAADPQTIATRFEPSLARTASGDYIPARALMMQDYCGECHADALRDWQHSMHRFSSFNNPAYAFSVRETRRVVLRRDGNLDASRFCAGCHDPVPFFSGAFDDPDFDEASDVARAGITCTACHAITEIGILGNGDYTIEAPLHYPFAASDKPLLRAINHQLIKARPELHKKTFMKPFHRTAEFCSTCHKVHIPRSVNGYKWLRGQNHYDAFRLSGVSGHSVASFYYPPRAVENCAACHMPLYESDDLAARDFDGKGGRKVHDHLFPAANTGVPALAGLPRATIERRREFLAKALRVDIFGLKNGGTIEGELTAPLRPEVPVLQPGRRYLLEVVVRTTGVGHTFTQGTADSNQVWLHVEVRDARGIIGGSGAMDEAGRVDPWAHFINAYVLDRDGHRIDRRNAQDIFVALYDHQIPPGAADVIHYAFEVPREARDFVDVRVQVKYRKFDTPYLAHIQGDAFKRNDLPVTLLAEDRVRFPVAGGKAEIHNDTPAMPAWERWNDYGIGLLRKARKGSGELRQAETAFRAVEALGRADGPLNLARVHYREGRLGDAAEALRRAATMEPPAPAWVLSWFSALVDKQHGALDEAIAKFRALAETAFPDARARGFDFSRDTRLLNELGQTLYERARRERGPGRRAQREALLREAAGWFEQVLRIDPEDLTAHYNLAQVYTRLGDLTRAEHHRLAHLRYKPDDDARARAVTVHRRRNPAADHAASAVAVYDLQRPDSPVHRLASAVTGIGSSHDRPPTAR